MPRAFKSRVLSSLAGAAIVLCTGAVVAGQLCTATDVTFATSNPYKDSFYFVDNGIKYLAVSDLALGGISLLMSNGGSDADYRFHAHVVGGNRFAPTLVQLDGNGNFAFVTTNFNFNESYLETFVYNVRTGAIGAISNVDLSGGELGMTDATIWYEPGKGWYLMGAKWQAGVLGSRLQWAAGSSPTGPFSFPVDLYDSPGGGERVDYDLRGSQIDWVVEAPIWSYWDHNGDGFHELYWSIGPSDPKVNGVCSTWVKAVRRGDINWNGNTPWIYVWGPSGGNADMMTSNMDCDHLTHPDFTQSGEIRGTSMKQNQFVVVNLPVY